MTVDAGGGISALEVDAEDGDKVAVVGAVDAEVIDDAAETPGRSVRGVEPVGVDAGEGVDVVVAGEGVDVVGTSMQDLSVEPGRSVRGVEPVGVDAGEGVDVQGLCVCGHHIIALFHEILASIMVNNSSILWLFID
jgi:hypothetical protein